MRIDRNLEKVFGTLNQSGRGTLEILEAVVAFRAHIVPKRFRTPDLDTDAKCWLRWGYASCKFSPGNEIELPPIFANGMITHRTAARPKGSARVERAMFRDLLLFKSIPYSSVASKRLV